MSKIELKRCQYVLTAQDANLSTSEFDEVSLERCFFTRVTFEEAEFNRVKITQSRGRDVNFEGSAFERSNFTNVKIVGGRYEGMTIDGVSVSALLAAYHAQNAGGLQ